MQTILTKYFSLLLIAILLSACGESSLNKTLTNTDSPSLAQDEQQLSLSAPTTLREEVIQKFGLAENRLAFRQEYLQKTYKITETGISYWGNDPRGGYSEEMVGKNLLVEDFVTFQFPNVLIGSSFRPALVELEEYSEIKADWPTKEIIDLAKEEAMLLPTQPLNTTPSRQIHYEDMRVVGYTYSGEDYYNILKPFSNGFKVEQPDDASFAVSVAPGVYFNQHISNFRLKAKVTFTGAYKRTINLGSYFGNSGIYIGNKKINFNDPTQISPWPIGATSALVENFGVIYEPIIGVFTVAKGKGFPTVPGSHFTDTYYMVVEARGTQLRAWIGENTQSVQMLDFSQVKAEKQADEGKTFILDNDSAGAVGFQIEGTNFTVTDFTITPIESFTDDSSKNFYSFPMN